MQLAVADVERDHARGAALEQHVGEPAGRRADVEAVEPGDVETERVERIRELVPGTRDVRRRRLDLERRVLVHLLAGLRVARHEPGHHERLGLRARLGEAALDEQHVEPLAEAPSSRRRATASPATISASTAVSAVNRREPRLRPLGRLVGEAAGRRPRRRRAPSRRRRAGRRRAGTAAPSSARERAPRRCSPAGTSAACRPHIDRGLEQRTGLQPVARCSRSRCRLRDRAAGRRSSPSVAVDELARDRPVGYASASRNASPSSASPARIAVASPYSRPHRRHGRAARRRRRAPADRRGRARTCARARPRPPPAEALDARADRVAGREAEHRPDPLAAARERVAHRARRACRAPASSASSAR